jgi:hypothetical protein
MKATSADGVEGILIYTGSDKYVFRVYNKDYSFIDYDILHFDLRVKINDDDAFFYTDGERHLLDYSKKTLGAD